MSFSTPYDVFDYYSQKSEHYMMQYVFPFLPKPERKQFLKSLHYKQTADLVRFRQLSTYEQQHQFFKEKQLRGLIQNSVENFVNKHNNVKVFVLSLAPSADTTLRDISRYSVEYDFTDIDNVIQHISEKFPISYSLEYQMQATPCYLSNKKVLVRPIIKPFVTTTYSPTIGFRRSTRVWVNDNSYSAVYKILDKTVHQQINDRMCFSPHAHVMCRERDYHKIVRWSKAVRSESKGKVKVFIRPANRGNNVNWHSWSNYVGKSNITMGKANCHYGNFLYDAPLVNDALRDAFSNISYRLAEESSQSLKSTTLMSKAWLFVSMLADKCATHMEQFLKPTAPPMKQYDFKNLRALQAKKAAELREFIINFKNIDHSSPNFFEEDDNSPKTAINNRPFHKNPRKGCDPPIKWQPRG